MSIFLKSEKNFTKGQLAFNLAGLAVVFIIFFAVSMVILTGGDIQPVEGIKVWQWLTSAVIAGFIQNPIRALLNRHSYAYFYTKYDWVVIVILFIISFFATV